jgi:serine phosphatase RsbU (regulator of sigma subunit)
MIMTTLKYKLMNSFFRKSMAVAAVTLIFSVLACEKKEVKGLTDFTHPDYSSTDSLVMNAINSVDRHIFYADDYDEQRADFLVDSLKQIIDRMEADGDLSEAAADVWRGKLYQYANFVDDAEECYRHAMTYDSPADRHLWYYNFAGSELAYLLYMRHNYDGFLRVAVPLLASMDSLGNGLYNQKIDLYSLIGCCYLKLEQPDKAKEIVIKARDYGREVLAVDTSAYIHQFFINSYARIKDAYVRVKDFEGARNWMLFTDSIGNLFKRRYPEAEVWPIYDAYTHLDRAIKVWSLGLTDSAAVEFAEFKKYRSAWTLNGAIQANDYLMNAGRWDDAADRYEVLDWYVDKPYLEDISAYYFPKLRANYYAGRKDSALATAMQIAEMFDSAYIWQKRSSMAEMATVYDTQGKEMKIARQQAELSQQRLVGTGIALVLLTAFFVIYTLYRRRAQKRLAAAHQQLETAHEKLETAHTQLQTAYDQLEETTAAKERIESELRIARDIQMSMVPGIFPEYQGLDMFAEMNPAKEVGGDLYGYLLQGDKLYLCLGDVSGKGVPASLFMAQSARLFRTLATEGMMPAEIAYRMNNELAENNDRGMFVTMFIGLLHLDTGRLDFCNCGHNAPVIDGEFLKMEYDNQPLGLWEDDPFEGESIDDIRGRQLLIYTDGLNEAENMQQELLGNKRLLELMSGTQSLTSHEVIDMLKNAVEQHRAGADPNDDLTLMCLRLN